MQRSSRRRRDSMRKSVVMASLVCALACGCATGPSVSEVGARIPVLAPDRGRVYFYRTGVIGAAYQPEVTLNGALVGKATPKGAYFRDVPPGPYTVTTSMTRETVAFD